MFPTPNASKAGNDVNLTCSGDGREKPNKLGWAVAESLLPTPRHEGFDAGAHRGKPDSLHAAVKMAPTPRPCTGDRSSGMNRTKLCEWMDENGGRMLPTPTAQDGKNNGGPSQAARNSLPLNTLVKQEGMKLSAAWVSRLMGYPDDWLSVP